MRLLAVMALLVASCASPIQWLVQHEGCTPTYAFPILTLIGCMDGAVGSQRCIYKYEEHGLACRWQLERPSCTSQWYLVAHSCELHTPYDDASWDGGIE